MPLHPSRPKVCSDVPPRPRTPKLSVETSIPPSTKGVLRNRIPEPVPEVVVTKQKNITLTRKRIAVTRNKHRNVDEQG